VTPAALLLALAAAFPGVAALLRLDVVATITRAAETHHVPPRVLAAVCFAESRLGTAPAGYASLCGVRVHHVYVSSDALAADIAARSLGRRRAECGTWARALAYYRWGGGCGVVDRTRYGARVLHVARRLGWREL